MMQRHMNLAYDMAVTVGATEMAVFQLDALGLDEPKALYHVRPDKSSTETRNAAIAAFKEILRPCADAAKDGAIEVTDPDATGRRFYCLVVLVRQDARVVGAAMFIVRCSDNDEALALLARLQRKA